MPAFTTKGAKMPALIFDRRELAGALGDIGVLLPLMAGLILVCGISAFTVFLLTGVMYVVTGVYFRLPVPVQPLKAMAAIAIAGGAGAEELAAGGIIMGALLVFMSITGLASRLSSLFAPWTVKGVQLAVGLMLIKSSLSFLNGSGSAVWKGAAALGPKGTDIFESLQVSGPGLPSLSIPGRESFVAALFLLVIPQVPVTFGNSVVATADVARSYFGQRAARVTPKALCASLGIANTVIGFLGGMPVCHGSGGMTAHYRLGARSGGAAVLMGMLLITLALLFGDSAVYLILMLPLPVLGGFMVYVGVQHARLVLGLREQKLALTVAVAIGVVSLLWGNIALGMAVGVGVSLLAGAARRAVAEAG